MMRGRNGFRLWNEATRLAVDTRKAIRRMRRQFEARAGGMIAYLKLFEESYARFPGFENEIQGVYPEQDALTGIDRRNARLVVGAVAHAAGLPDPYQETDKHHQNG